MSKAKIEIRNISQPGQCILTLIMPNDHENTPTLQVQMPTNVAKWFKAAADDRDDSPNDFAEK